MPSSRGASSHRPEAERRLHARARWLCSAALLVSSLIPLNASGQSAEEPRPRANAQASSAGSEERPRAILLVRTENDEGVMNRVRAELHASAWQLVELRVEDRSARTPLAQLAAQQAVRAAVRFDASEARIELWIFRATGNVEETIASSAEREEDAVLALRITEELRARGLSLTPESAQNGSTDEGKDEAARAVAQKEIVKGPRAAANEQAARAPEVTGTGGAEPAPFSTELWLELGPALEGSPGGLGPTLAGWGSVRLELAPRWGCSLLGVIPLASPELHGSEGSAQVSTYLVGASADLAWLRAPRFQLGVGAGVAWARTEMSGAGNSGYTSERDSVSSVAPLARATARLQVSGRFWLGFGALAGMTLPEVSVKFGDRIAGQWGRPLLLATLDLQLLAAHFPRAVRGVPAGP
jgi:hypothetical protein